MSLPERPVEPPANTSSARSRPIESFGHASISDPVAYVIRETVDRLSEPSPEQIRSVHKLVEALSHGSLLQTGRGNLNIFCREIAQVVASARAEEPLELLRLDLMHTSKRNKALALLRLGQLRPSLSEEAWLTARTELHTPRNMESLARALIPTGSERFKSKVAALAAYGECSPEAIVGTVKKFITCCSVLLKHIDDAELAALPTPSLAPMIALTRESPEELGDTLGKLLTRVPHATSRAHLIASYRKPGASEKKPCATSVITSRLSAVLDTGIPLEMFSLSHLRDVVQHGRVAELSRPGSSRRFLAGTLPRQYLEAIGWPTEALIETPWQGRPNRYLSQLSAVEPRTGPPQLSQPPANWSTRELVHPNFPNRR